MKNALLAATILSISTGALAESIQVPRNSRTVLDVSAYQDFLAVKVGPPLDNIGDCVTPNESITQQWVTVPADYRASSILLAYGLGVKIGLGLNGCDPRWGAWGGGTGVSKAYRVDLPTK